MSVLLPDGEPIPLVVLASNDADVAPLLALGATAVIDGPDQAVQVARELLARYGRCYLVGWQTAPGGVRIAAASGGDADPWVIELLRESAAASGEVLADDARPSVLPADPDAGWQSIALSHPGPAARVATVLAPLADRLRPGCGRC